MSSEASEGFERVSVPVERVDRRAGSTAHPPAETGVSGTRVQPAAVYRAELAVRDAAVAALECELARRERRFEEVVERYETLLTDREDERDEEERAAGFAERGFVASLRDRLPW